MLHGAWKNNFPKTILFFCSVFEALGEVGILNAVAVPNENVNIDEIGDLPALCPTDFILAVTSVDADDKKVDDAGFGLINVDLGAFGEEVYTTTNNDSYDFEVGTSFATPHVAGAIAFLYAAPCAGIMTLGKADPAAAALLIKNYILSGAKGIPTLDGITSTGGRLNINNSLNNLLTNCSDCLAASSAQIENRTLTSADLSWKVNENIVRVDVRWKAVTESTWDHEPTFLTSPITINDLLACTTYEVQLKTYCNSDTLGYSESIFFTTDGCCDAPDNFNAPSGLIQQNRVSLFWAGVTAAQEYTVRIRPKGESDWQSFMASNSPLNLNVLESCTVYEAEIQSNCGEENSNFGALEFRTLGCGACLEESYCAVSNLTTEDEWIQRVFITENAFDNVSGDNGGYADFTAPDGIKLKRGNTYNILIEVGYTGSVFDEYFKIWVDLNQNGSLTSGELLFENASGIRNQVTASLTIPVEAPLGNTRMRIGMLAQPGFSSCNSSENFGEYEDYCIEITNLDTGIPKIPEQELNITVSPNPFKGELTVLFQFDQPNYDGFGNSTPERLWSRHD